MIEIVGILVRGESFSLRFNSQRIPLKVGDACLVESGFGLQIGKVMNAPTMVKPRFIEGKLPRVIRKASAEDVENLDKIISIESEAKQFCIERMRSYNLEMKLAKVIFAFDKSKATFMFTAEGRIDFRGLVRDLAQQFKTRIEMKQIGIRDEARLIGGIGNCGCTLCCTTFLRDFHSVSIKKAKDQGLSLIPNKISGLCGRLMCCLEYEHEHYSEQAKLMPKIGKRVITPKGVGKVRQLGILKQLVFVELEDGECAEFKLEDIEFTLKPSSEKTQENIQVEQPSDRQRPGSSCFDEQDDILIDDDSDDEDENDDIYSADDEFDSLGNNTDKWGD